MASSQYSLNMIWKSEDDKPRYSVLEIDPRHKSFRFRRLEVDLGHIKDGERTYPVLDWYDQAMAWGKMFEGLKQYR